MPSGARPSESQSRQLYEFQSLVRRPRTRSVAVQPLDRTSGVASASWVAPRRTHGDVGRLSDKHRPHPARRAPAERSNCRAVSVRVAMISALDWRDRPVSPRERASARSSATVQLASGVFVGSMLGVARSGGRSTLIDSLQCVSSRVVTVREVLDEQLSGRFALGTGTARDRQHPVFLMEEGAGDDDLPFAGRFVTVLERERSRCAVRCRRLRRRSGTWGRCPPRGSAPTSVGHGGGPRRHGR